MNGTKKLYCYLRIEYKDLSSTQRTTQFGFCFYVSLTIVPKPCTGPKAGRTTIPTSLITNIREGLALKASQLDAPEHDDFAADKTENGRRNTGGLPSSRRRFDDEVARTLQGRKNLRQNRIHRKCWFSTHHVDRNTALPRRQCCSRRPYQPAALLYFCFL
jgi:hypothetical protein